MGTSQHKLKRNSLCPCGSGKKFKHCCAARTAPVREAPEESSHGIRWIVLPAAAVAILMILLIPAMLPENHESALGTMQPGSLGTTEPGATPDAWHYDAAGNQHWDPNHGHWHQGPPPSNPGQRGLETGENPPAPSAPEAWDYDATADQHWDPNHGHWHDGPPPDNTVPDGTP